MKKVKTIFMSLFLAVVIAVVACSCGNNEQSTDTSAPQSSIGNENSPADSTVSSDGSFDFDEVCKNIVINGKQYTFPFSVEELGEGYSIDDISYSILDENDEYYSASTELMYNDFKIANVWYYGINENEIETIDLSDRKIDYLNQGRKTANQNGIYIEVGGIKIGDSSNDVLEKFGEPSKEMTDEDNGSYIYTDEKKILTYIYLNNVISSIDIAVNDNY